MGIDLHGLRFLQYLAKDGNFKATATLGRQNIHVTDGVLRTILLLPPDKRYGPFCESLLAEKFGSTFVTSFDAANYEQASVVHDFNEPLVHEHAYDTIIDFGTLEHIFNVPTALRNVANICRVGGQIIHALPANNYNGHGLWQFSPELFFSLYSDSNGFSNTEIFIAELDDEQNWWKVTPPKNGVRVEYTSASRSYVLVRTRKRSVVSSQNVQQSDYVVAWEHGQLQPEKTPNPTKSWFYSPLKQTPLLWRLADTMFPTVNLHSDARMHQLSRGNHHFTKVSIAALLSAG